MWPDLAVQHCTTMEDGTSRASRLECHLGDGGRSALGYGVTGPRYREVPFVTSSLKVMTPLAPAKSPVPAMIGCWQRPWIAASVTGSALPVNLKEKDRVPCGSPPVQA